MGLLGWSSQSIATPHFPGFPSFHPDFVTFIIIFNIAPFYN